MLPGEGEPGGYHQHGVRRAENLGEATHRRVRRLLYGLGHTVATCGLLLGVGFATQGSSNPVLAWAMVALLLSPWLAMALVERRRPVTDYRGGRRIQWDKRVCLTCGRVNQHGWDLCTNCRRKLHTPASGQYRRPFLARR